MASRAPQLKRWAEAWNRAGPRLERIRREGLRDLDGPACLVILDGLLEWACANARPRAGSGLVEQQRLFSKLRGSP